MIGDKLTDVLLQTINNQVDPININSKENNNREESLQMANLKEQAEKQKAKLEAERIAKENSKVEAAVTETEENKEVETETVVDKKTQAQELLARAKAGATSGAVTEDGKMRETNTFVGEGNEELTEEEIKARMDKKKTDEEKEAAKIKRAALTAEHNKIMEAEHSEIMSRTGNIEITAEHQTYQAACHTFGRHVAFLIPEGPAPKLGISTTYPKVDNALQPREGVSVEDIRTIQNKAKVTAYEKRDHYKFTARIKYTYSRPKNDFGSVIRIPQILNLNLTQITHQTFPTVNQEEIEASPVVYIPYSSEAFFSIVMICFGGEILEEDRMANTKAAKKSELNAIRAALNTVRVKKNDLYTGEVKYNKVTQSLGRKNLYVMENIIPYKLADTIKVSELQTAKGLDTKTYFDNAFATALGAGKGNVAPYSELDENSAQLIVAELDQQTKAVTNLTNKLLTGDARFGEGAAKKIVLTHWSDTYSVGDGSYNAITVEAILPRKIGTPKKDNPAEYTYKQAYKQLGINMTLADLNAMGYTAAGELVKGHLDPQLIGRLYAEHMASIKQKRQNANANKATSSKNTIKKSTLIDADSSLKLILAQIQKGGSDDKMDFDAEEAKKSLISTSYIKRSDDEIKKAQAAKAVNK